MANLKRGHTESMGKTFHYRGARSNPSSLVYKRRGSVTDSDKTQDGELDKLEEKLYRSLLFRALLIAGTVGMFYGFARLGIAGFSL